MVETAKKTAAKKAVEKPEDKTETKTPEPTPPPTEKPEDAAAVEEMETVMPGHMRSNDDHAKDRLKAQIANAKTRGYTTRAASMQAKLDAM